MSLVTTIVHRLLDETPELDPRQFVDDFMRQQNYDPRPSGVEDHDILRHVRVLRRYQLVLWDPNIQNDRSSHHYIGYRFISPDRKILFQGTDLGIPGGMSIDSDEAVSELLHFITLQPGDTDDEYFENYSPEQLEFVEGPDAEEIRMDLIDGGQPYEDVQAYE